MHRRRAPCWNSLWYNTPVMIAKLVLDKKREGHALGSAEIREFIEGFTRGTVPDYQMSALAMAICCRGMTERETADLTDAMMRSGACLEWGGLPVPTADKHSTGGVGDKMTTGQQLATLERSSDPDGLEPAAAELYRAFRISSSAPESTPLILERVPELALA